MSLHPYLYWCVVKIDICIILSKSQSNIWGLLGSHILGA